MYEYYIQYSLKCLEDEIFVDFGVASYLQPWCNTSAIHKKFIHEIAKFVIPWRFKSLKFLGYAVHNYESCIQLAT